MSVDVGRGQAFRDSAVGRLLRWEAKTRSGFDVVPEAGTSGER